MHDSRARDGSRPRVRLVQIDGLRAVAALSVVAFHYTTRFDEIFVHTTPPPFALSQGFLGVQLFFVISGFVISMTIEASERPSDFVVSRFSRLFPTYWVAVLVTWAVLSLSTLPGVRRTLGEVLVNLTMLQGMFGVERVDGVYWSLEVELLFYGWMLLLWTTQQLRRLAPVMVAWVGASLVAACLERVGIRVPWALTYACLMQWIPWFALGIAAYLRARLSRLALTVLLASALSAIFVREGVMFTTIGVLAFFAVVLAADERLKPAAWKPLVFIGALSYPLYLVHEKIGWITILEVERRGWPPALGMVAAFAISLSIAYGLHRAIEVPATRAIRRKWRDASTRSTPARPVDLRRWAGGCVAMILIAATGNRLSTWVSDSGEPSVAGDRLVARADASRPDNVALRECVFEHGARPLVLLVFGASNAANTAQGDVLGPTNVIVGPRCVVTNDPLPRVPGNGVSLWTGVAMRLQERLPNRPIVIVPSAAPSAIASQWTGPGSVREGWMAQIASMQALKLNADAVLVQQGEPDNAVGTEAQAFVTSIRQLRRELDALGVRAPMLIARSTRCRDTGSGALGRAWDRWVFGDDDRIVRGPDTDALADAERFDGCHFNAHGRDLAADLWTRTLLSRLAQ